MPWAGTSSSRTSGPDHHQTGGGADDHRQEAAQDPAPEFLEVVHQAHLHLAGEIILGRWGSPETISGRGVGRVAHASAA